MEEIYKNDGQHFYDIKCPNISSTDEVDFMIKCLSDIEFQIRKNKVNWVTPDGYNFVEFLMEKIKQKWLY